MRYQINAILNNSTPDFDALVRLLAESCEKFELQKLDLNGATRNRKGGGRPTRYGRFSPIRVAKQMPRASITPLARDLHKLLANHFGDKVFTRKAGNDYLHSVVPKERRRSISPSVTQLLDAKALEVVEVTEATK